MADIIITNRKPISPSPWYGLHLLVETLLATGKWSVVEMSLAGVVSAADNWTARYVAHRWAAAAATSWIILEHSTAGQICFRRTVTNGEQHTHGWIVWSKGKGFVIGGTALAPANIPADAVFIRGTGAVGTPGTWTAAATWFGRASAMEYINIGARGGGGADASWYFAGKESSALWATGAHHWIAFENLDSEVGDTAPYAWSAPAAASNWTNTWDSYANWIATDNVGGTSGFWHRWWNAGQVGEAFKRYASGILAENNDTGGYTGIYPSSRAPVPSLIYVAARTELALAIKLWKTNEVAFRDGNGGFTTNLKITSPLLTPSNRLLNSGDYAKLGSYLTVWWDGDANNPPRD